MSAKYLCDGIDQYLTEEAHSALTMLMERGFDKDLAFEILSRTTPEEDLYDLPNPIDTDTKWKTLY